MKMAIMVDGKVVKCTIENVLHVPSLGYNLLSVGTTEAKGMTVRFGGGLCSIFAGSKKIARGTRMGNIYMLDISVDTGISFLRFARFSGLSSDFFTNISQLWSTHFLLIYPNFYNKLPKLAGTTTAAAVTCLHCQAPLRSGICDI
jgi:hypothetical protein